MKKNRHSSLSNVERNGSYCKYCFKSLPSHIQPPDPSKPLHLDLSKIASMKVCPECIGKELPPRSQTKQKRRKEDEDETIKGASRKNRLFFHRMDKSIQNLQSSQMTDDQGESDSLVQVSGWNSKYPSQKELTHNQPIPPPQLLSKALNQDTSITFLDESSQVSKIHETAEFAPGELAPQEIKKTNKAKKNKKVGLKRTISSGEGKQQDSGVRISKTIQPSQQTLVSTNFSREGTRASGITIQPPRRTTLKQRLLNPKKKGIHRYSQSQPQITLSQDTSDYLDREASTKQLKDKVKQISAFYDTEQVQVTVRGPSVEEMLDPNHEKSAVLRQIEPEVRRKAENFDISIFEAAYLKMNQIKRNLESDPQFIAKNTMLRASRNPCPVHIDQEIGYISLKDKSPFCVKCFPQHNGDGQEILTFETAVKKMAAKMMNVTASIDEKIEQKQKTKATNEEAINVIQQVRSEFIEKQSEKIKALKDYLDAIFTELVTQYDTKIDKDLLKIKANIGKIQRQIFENQTLKTEIDKFKIELKKGKRTPNLLEKLVQAGKYCTYTYYMDLGESEKIAEIEPQYYRESKPLITLYAEKEYEQLMRRLSLLDDSVIMPSRATNALKMMSEPGKSDSLSPSPSKEQKNRLSPLQRSREEHPRKLSRSVRGDSDQEKEEPGFQFHNLAKRAAIVREKIVIPRWMSNKLGIYDLSAKQWHFKRLKSLDLHFLPLSCTVYTPTHDFFCLGGLNEQVPRKPSFSNQCLSISLHRQSVGGRSTLNSFDSTYRNQRHSPMLQSRGSFPGVYVEGKIYALGGKQMMVNPISDCEAFQLKKNTWRRIGSLNTGRSNACACAVSAQYIYIIGGRTSVYQHDDVQKKDALGSSIQYLNISANEWYQLRVRLPFALQYMSCVQVSRTKIMVFGGSKIKRSIQGIRDSADGNLGARNQIYSIEFARGKIQKVSQPEELRTQWVKGFLSVYPMYMSQDKRVHLVSEDAEKNEHPKVCSFSLPELIKHLK